MNQAQQVFDRVQSWLRSDSKTRGMSIALISQASEVNRATLYKAMADDWNPKCDTLIKLWDLIPEDF